MNKNRRKQLERIVEQLENLRDDLEMLKDEEQE
jgi:exonuclease VII small subunit